MSLGNSYIVCKNIETTICNETNEIKITPEIRCQALHQDMWTPLFQQTNCFCEVISALNITDERSIIEVIHARFNLVFFLEYFTIQKCS